MSAMGRKQQMILVDNSSPLDYDDLLEDAIKICVQYDRASASLLQRRLSIGYARAARLMDQLEFIGILGKSEGANPREVLATKEKTKNKSKVSKEGSREFLTASCELIRQTLLAYGIQIRVNSVSVTEKNICFFMEVAIGTKLDKLLGLKKELAMILASPTGKIELFAPFKGTSMVALYLPTKNKLKKSSYRAIHANFEIKEPSNKFLFYSRLAVKETLLRLSNLFYNLAYKI